MSSCLKSYSTPSFSIFSQFSLLSSAPFSSLFPSSCSSSAPRAHLAWSPLHTEQQEEVTAATSYLPARPKPALAPPFSEHQHWRHVGIYSIFFFTILRAFEIRKFCFHTHIKDLMQMMQLTVRMGMHQSNFCLAICIQRYPEKIVLFQKFSLKTQHKC